MEQDLQQTVSLLARTPAVLDALLRNTPDTWTLTNEGEQSWSPFDVVGHLVHCERADWMPRLDIILESGESQPFPPLDRSAHLRSGHTPTMAESLDDFARLRAENLARLDALHLTPEQFARRGRHPALGVVTLSELLATWAVHDLTHLHQITRVMAHQYREAVGPWSRFLGVLQCSGHSAEA